MEVQLYVYDLTRGMAKTMSMQLLGIHIEAVYHTALVFGGIEYFYGAGVQTCYPGTTHHGQPMEVISLGATQLPMDTIMDYLESLKDIYTPESYDLFAHNCNNFTHDFSLFLVGKGIPDHITSLPKRVLDTPFGQMLKPQIDQSMRSITQAPVPAQNKPPVPNGSSQSKAPSASASTSKTPATDQIDKPARYGEVVDLVSLDALQKHLASASDTCVTIFFTSSTCAPCRIAYPAYDSLAGEHSQALFVKVDINSAHDVASRYQIRATPTFMTLGKGGVKQDEWSGADPTLLRSNIERLINETFPPHRHLTLKLPTLQYGSMRPVTFAKLPPLDKLMAKLGSAASHDHLASLRSFIEAREKNPKDAPLPALPSISRGFQSKIFALPTEIRFAAVDLLRCAMIDPRVGGFFAEEKQPRTIPAVVEHVNKLKDCPHNLRLVTIHLACNIFASPLYIRELLTSDDTSIAQLLQLVTTSLLDASHPTTRVASASLAFNLATANYRTRREEGQDALAEGEQVELAASLLESLSQEENPDATKALLLAFAYLIYCAPENGELFDLCSALDAKAKVRGSKGHDALAQEIASLL